MVAPSGRLDVFMYNQRKIRHIFTNKYPTEKFDLPMKIDLIKLTNTYLTELGIKF